MSITSNAELEAAVASWLDRDDLAARIPDFIVLAEARFNRVIRAPDMLTRDDAFTVDGQYEDLPTGFIEASRFVLLTSPVRPLDYLTPQELSDERHMRTSAGKPAHFSVIGGSFEFLPSPDSAYMASLLYYARLTPVASSWNWLASSHPDIYLFGAMVEAEPFIRDDPRMVLWKRRLDEALAELDVMNSRKKVPGAARPRTRGFEW